MFPWKEIAETQKAGNKDGAASEKTPCLQGSAGVAASPEVCVQHEAVEDMEKAGVEEPLHSVAVPAREEAQLLER